MKKSLIALAVLAASGAAMAQSSVTLFGIIDTNVSYLDGIDNGAGGTDNKYGLGTSGNATSRLGFRGVEDLGGGLKAGFWLEGEIFGDNGNASGFDFKRRSTVSLMGNFGEVRLGRDKTPVYAKISSYDVFDQAGFGQFLGWSNWRNDFAAGLTDTDGKRKNNLITYFTPNISGFSGAIGYGFDEQTTGKLGRYAGGYAAYDNGPVSVALAYDQSDLGNTSGHTVERDVSSVSGSYDFGVAKLSGIYQHLKDKESGGAPDSKVDSYALGVSAPVGPGVVKLQYALYDQKAIDSKANQYSLGYVYDLSKRTAVYGTVSYMDNNDNSQLGLPAKSLGNGNNPALRGDSQTGVQVGIRHSF